MRVGLDVSPKSFLLKSRMSAETLIPPFRRKYKRKRARYPATYKKIINMLKDFYVILQYLNQVGIHQSEGICHLQRKKDLLRPK